MGKLLRDIMFWITLAACILLGMAFVKHGIAGDDWDTYDKSVFVAHQVFRTVDMFQTQDIYNHKEFYEKNPIIDRGVDEFGTHFIPVYFVAMGVAEYLIADALPNPYRKVFLTAGTMFTIGLVHHNKSIGLGMSFEF